MDTCERCGGPLGDDPAAGRYCRECWDAMGDACAKCGLPMGGEAVLDGSWYVCRECAGEGE